MGHPKVPGRAHLRVHHYSWSSLRIWTITTLDHSIQSNWVLPHFQETWQYSYPYHFLYSNFMYSIPILNKITFLLLIIAILPTSTLRWCWWDFPHSETIMSLILLIGFPPLKTTPMLGFSLLGVGPSADEIFPARRTVFVRSADGIFPTRKR